MTDNCRGNLYEVTEGSNHVFTVTLVDENGEAIDGGDLTALTLTLRDDATGEIINNRNGQNVLNDNNVTVDDAGLLTWNIQPNDNPILNTRLKHETHVAEFSWGWSGKTATAEIFLLVHNINKSCNANWMNRVRRRIGYGSRIVELSDDHICEAIEQSLDMFNNFIMRLEWGFIPETTEYQKVIRFGADATDPYEEDPDLLSIVRVDFTRPGEINATQEDVFSLAARMQGGGYYGGYGGRVGRMAPAGRYGFGDILFWKQQREAINRVSSNEPDWYWDDVNRWLSLYMPTGPFEVSYQKAYRHTIDTIPPNYASYFLDAVEGHSRLILAQIRGKFGPQIPGPTGGVPIDSDFQQQRGEALIQRVDEFLRKLPLQAFPEFG